MAKYKAAPFYVVTTGESSVKFDWLGEYETDKAGEIKALDALVPKWIKRIDDPEQEPVKTEDKPDDAPDEVKTEAAVADTVDKPDETPKPTARGRKSSGK